MKIGEILIYVLAAISASSAAAVLLVRNIFHAALLLMVSLLGVAGIFAILNAEFLAVAQILVYAGGILLLIVFGIMLTERHGTTHLQAGRQNFIVGLLAGAGLISILFVHVGSLQVSTQAAQPVGLSQVGFELVGKFAAPFELAGILLLVSMIGAMIVASFERKA